MTGQMTSKLAAQVCPQ